MASAAHPGDPTGADLPTEAAIATVLARRPAGFLYGVTTTGIFCRTTCPSRRPRPGNVRIFPTATAATDAGFRPCRRCRPDEVAPGRAATGCVLVGARLLLDGETDLARVAAATGCSDRQLRRAFGDVVGCTPAAFRTAVRVGHARDELRRAFDVLEAAYAGGFATPSAFYDAVGPTLGMTPSTYRHGARGERIVWTTWPDPIGTVLVASTARGLCALRIGGDAAALHEQLAAEFAGAELVAATGELDDTTAAIRALLAGAPALAELDLDVRGTAFQARVWQALRRIPAGETCTYRDLAEAVGAPGSHRAVANACGRNPVAVVVPCHRVVRSDGSLGGYRWGLEVKAELLRRERSARTD